MLARTRKDYGYLMAVGLISVVAALLRFADVAVLLFDESRTAAVPPAELPVFSEYHRELPK